MSKKVEPENNKGNVALEGGKQKGTMQKGTTLVTFQNLKKKKKKNYVEIGPRPEPILEMQNTNIYTIYTVYNILYINVIHTPVT